MVNIVEKLFRKCSNLRRKRRSRLYQRSSTTLQQQQQQQQRQAEDEDIPVIVDDIDEEKEEPVPKDQEDLLYQCIQNAFSAPIVLTVPRPKTMEQQQQKHRWSTGMIKPAVVIHRDPFEAQRRSAHFIIRNMPPPTCGYHYLTSIPETSMDLV